jgi:hypothetical protein
MVNTARTQYTQNALPQQIEQSQRLYTRVRGRQDNPAPSPAPLPSPQPAPPKNTIRTAPKNTQMPPPRQKKTRLGKDVQLSLWVRPVVKAELERVAKREGLSVSSAGEALLEKALQQDMYTQHGALLETILDRAVGRHMRTYSDRNAGLQARNLQKTELVFSLVTNILGRMPGMDEETITKILSDADDAANASITRTTLKQRKIVEAEKQHFEGKGGITSA